MGEGTRKFAGEVDPKDLDQMLQGEQIFYSPVDVLLMLDDTDPAVRGLFRSIRRNLAKAVSGAAEGSREKTEAERLLGVFDTACKSAGIISGETVKKQQLGVMRSPGLGVTKPSESVNLRELVRDFDEIADDGTMKPGAEAKATTLEIARMTGDFLPIRNSKGRGNDRNVKIAQSRMKYIKKGDITMEISVRGENSPKLKAGDKISLMRADERVRVKVKWVGEEHDNIFKLLAKDGLELEGRWLPNMDLSDIELVARRMFKDATSDREKLIAFEFELID